MRIVIAACCLATSVAAFASPVESGGNSEAANLIEQMHPLFQILARSEVESLRQYIADGNSLSPEVEGEHTAISFAAVASEPEILGVLFEAGADINQVANQRSPLEHAVLYRKFENARKLVQLGADVSKRCLDQFSAIEYAAAANNFELAREIFTAGYDTGVALLLQDLEAAAGLTQPAAIERDRLQAIVEDWLVHNDDNKIPRHCK